MYTILQFHVDIIKWYTFYDFILTLQNMYYITISYHCKNVYQLIILDVVDKKVYQPITSNVVDKKCINL